MTAPLLLAVAIIYIWVAIGYIASGRTGMALAFIAYALANIGFLLDLRK